MLRRTHALTGLPTAILLLALPLSQSAFADHLSEPTATLLGPVTVQGETPESLTTPTVTEARQRLHQVPGGTTLVDAETFTRGSTGNLKDAVALVPGVYAQDRAGPGTRLSIRGSGISIPWAIKGVRLLRNGLPIMEADGWYHSQLFEPLTARYVEVYRGANALQYGASSLGGAINFVTHTGYTAAPLTARLEAGSHGYRHPQIAGGTVLGNGWDYYASLSGLYADGVRDHSETDSTIFYGNLGYRHSANAETRLHLSLADSSQELPGGLTRAQLHDDPTQANPGNRHYGAANEFDRYRLDLQHTLRLGDHQRVDFGLFYETQNIHHPLPYFVMNKDLQTYGASLRSDSRKSFLGTRHHFTWGGLVMLGDSEERYYKPLGHGDHGRLRHVDNSDVLTVELFAQDRFPIQPSLDLIIGAQLAYAERGTRIDSAQPGVPDRTPEESYFGASPKIGLLWQATDQQQVFGNISRSFEPPTLYDFNSRFNSASEALDAQTATTVEVGTRGGSHYWHWQIALYRAWVDDEILSAEQPPNSGRYLTANVEQTLHTGVELGLEGRLPLNWLQQGDDLHLQLAYTYNRFRFDDDPTFGDNQLPGIPRHFGRLELFYEHPSGLYIGPTLEVASSYFVDYANTLKADAYTLVGARIGYDTRRWSLFIEGSNLTDKTYAASTGVINNAAGQDRAVFNPGRERTVLAGVTFRLR